MKKCFIFMLFLLIPAVCMAVKYQVSCDLTYTDKSEFVAVWTYLDGKKNLGFLITDDDGDCLWPLSIDPNLPGNCRVKCRLRTASEEDRDAIWIYLMTTDPDPNASGYIERHICRWEERKPCTNQENILWGNEL